MRNLLIIAATTAALCTPAFAASGEGCTDQDMQATQASITAMPDGPDKDAAMKEFTMAQDAMKANDMKSCDDHSAKAKAAAKKK